MFELSSHCWNTCSHAPHNISCDILQHTRNICFQCLEIGRGGCSYTLTVETMLHQNRIHRSIYQGEFVRSLLTIDNMSHSDRSQEAVTRAGEWMKYFTFWKWSTSFRNYPGFLLHLHHFVHYFGTSFLGY